MSPYPASLDTMRLARLEGQSMAKYERDYAQPVAEKVKAPDAVKALVHSMEALSQRIDDMNVVQSKISTSNSDYFLKEINRVYTTT